MPMKNIRAVAMMLAPAASQLLLFRKLGTDVTKSLTPITRMVDAVLVAVSNPAMPVNSVTELFVLFPNATQDLIAP